MNDQQLQQLKIAAVAGAVSATIFQLAFNFGEGDDFWAKLCLAFVLFAAVGAATYFIQDRMNKR